ncbi:MAG: hypothetical protein M3261_04165, partial [Thermoproteota archaeon]|nr:hypothetical protein [Thermoproteota archaeon]
MKHVQPTQAFLRKRRFLMVLPLLVIPFFTMAFWAMGGGSNKKNMEEDGWVQGLNTSLPDAQLKEDKNLTKLNFYDQAQKEGKEGNVNGDEDLAFNKWLPHDTASDVITSRRSSYDPTPYHLAGYKDSNEQKVYQKLAQLNQQLTQTKPKVDQPPSGTAIKNYTKKQQSAISSDDLDRLENMMGAMNNREGT